MDAVTVGELYLIRHGEASGLDDSNPGLSETGRAQVRSLGARFAGRTVAGILHSPRRRAAETAALLSDALPGAPVRPSGVLEDRTPVPSRNRRDDYPQRYWPWLDDTAPDERDVDGVLLTTAVAELANAARAAAEAGPLVAVTHAFVIGWLVRSALDAPTSRWLGLHPLNSSLTIIRYAAHGATLVAFNDTGHLR